MAKMSGPPMKIHIDPKAIPIAGHKPIPIPHHWQEQVMADLDRDVKLGIIEKVPMGVPTTWQSRMVMVSKKTDKPMRTVDLSPLNKHCQRETHSTKVLFFQVSREHIGFLVNFPVYVHRRYSLYTDHGAQGTY